MDGLAGFDGYRLGCVALLIDLYWEERQLHCWRILALRPDLPEPYARPGEHREGGTTCPDRLRLAVLNRRLVRSAPDEMSRPRRQDHH